MLAGNSFLSDSSCLPKEINKVAVKMLEYGTFNENDILKILNAVHVRKAHGLDNISIWMLKICGASISHPLTIISKFA